VVLWVGVAVLLTLGVWFLVAVTTTSNTPNTTITNVPAVSATDVTNGVKNAKVTLIEYGDFQCPACGAYYPLVKQLLTEFNGKILFVYRMFPLIQLHPNAFAGAQTAVAAANQGKFMEMQDLLYGNQADWVSLQDPTSKFNDYAQKLGLNMNQFQADFASQKTKDFINKEEDGGTAIGVNATPTFFINGKQIAQNPQSYDAFKQLIEKALQ
ncbi:MAG: DsbA family protein, partial [Candidatus Levyibacteriota bacterium]